MTESTNCFVNEFCTLKLSQDVLQKKKKRCASNFISAYVFNLCAFLPADYLSQELLPLFKYNFFPCLLNLSWVFSLSL